MDTCASNQPDRLRNFEAVCKRARVRMTFQRMAVFQEVAGNDEHPDAEAVYLSVRRQIPTISLDTVYRTLWLLKSLGLISTVGAPREKTRFDGNPAEHHHFLCTVCGRIQDMQPQGFYTLEIPESVKDVGRVERARIEFQGTCLECLKLKGDGDVSHGSTS